MVKTSCSGFAHCHLVKVPWPVATVFGLFVEAVNGTLNEDTLTDSASPQPSRLRHGQRSVRGLQPLQGSGRLKFRVVERREVTGRPLPVERVTPRDVVAAARHGYAYRFDPTARTWTTNPRDRRRRDGVAGDA